MDDHECFRHSWLNIDKKLLSLKLKLSGYMY